MSELSVTNDLYMKKLVELVQVITTSTMSGELVWSVSEITPKSVSFSASFLNLNIKIEKEGDDAILFVGSHRLEFFQNGFLGRFSQGDMNALYDAIYLKYRDIVRIKRLDMMATKIGAINAALKVLRYYDTEGIPL